MIRSVRTAMMLAALATLLPAHADERCRDEPLLTGCDILTDQVTLPIPMETRSLALYWPLRNDNDGASLAFYRELIDRLGLAMPEKPALGMYIVNLSYNEGNLMLRAKLTGSDHDGDEGWYNLYMPVNDVGAYEAGEAIGNPKFLANVEFEFVPETGTPDTASVVASLEDGRITTGVTWTHDPDAPYSDELDDVTRFGSALFGLAPSHRGPARYRFLLSNNFSRPPASGEGSGVPERGWAQVTMDDHPQSWDAFTPKKIGQLFKPGEKLSTLVDFSKPVPATYLHQEFLLVYTIDKITDDPSFEPLPATPLDADGDTVPDEFDNCPNTWNRYQEDGDADFVGDACEADDDFNLTGTFTSNCEQIVPLLPGFPQQDGVCLTPTQTLDAILFGGFLEPFCNGATGVPGFDALCGDKDGDGVYNRLDNCPGHPNPEQANLDGDRFGDACDWRDDSDFDLDGTEAADDTCPTVTNYSQADSDGNGIGDACDNAARGEAGIDAGAGAGGGLLLLVLGGLRRRPTTNSSAR